MDSLFNAQENGVITARLAQIRDLWKDRIDHPEQETVFEYSGLSSKGLKSRKHFDEASIDAGVGIQEILRLVPAAAKLSREESDLLAQVTMETRLRRTYTGEQVAAFAKIEKAYDRNLVEPLMRVMGQIVTLADYVAVRGNHEITDDQLRKTARVEIVVLDALVAQRQAKVGVIDPAQSGKMTFSQLREKYPTPEPSKVAEPIAPMARKGMPDVPADSSLREYATPRGDIAEGLPVYRGGKVLIREGRLVES